MHIELTNKAMTMRYYPQIAKLIRSIWPGCNPGDTIDKYIDTLKNYNKGKFERHIMMFDGKEIIGYARIFKRTIIFQNSKINNMGLSDVCVKDEYQRQGSGRQIVQHAFEFVRNRKFECSIFQTKVPAFYIKLGAQIIDNDVINSTDIQIKPFKDPFIMLYPKDYYIGNEQIDLNGDGY